jgi:Fic family protein
MALRSIGTTAMWLIPYIFIVEAMNSQKLLEAWPEGFVGGLTNRKYVSLNRVSRETAKRDLADLEARGILKRSGGRGRSVNYLLKL